MKNKKGDKGGTKFTKVKIPKSKLIGMQLQGDLREKVLSDKDDVLKKEQVHFYLGKGGGILVVRTTFDYWSGKLYEPNAEVPDYMDCLDIEEGEYLVKPDSEDDYELRICSADDLSDYTTLIELIGERIMNEKFGADSNE